MKPIYEVTRFVGPTTNDKGETTVAYSEHRKAVHGSPNELGRSLRDMLHAWESYRDAHKDRYESRIGDDYVLGDYWAETGLAIKRLLDGETGGLDCGSLSANITNMIEAEGFKIDGYTIIHAE